MTTFYTAFLPSPLPCRRRRPRAIGRRCALSPRCSVSSALATGSEHARYLREIAGVKTVPDYLSSLLHLLHTIHGEELLTPHARKNVHPFVIPLSQSPASTYITGLLRWPTAPDTLSLPVVRVSRKKLCIHLLSASARAHVHRALATADFAGRAGELSTIRSFAENSESLYSSGEVDATKLGLERFLALKVGAFPDVYEGLAKFHLAKGDPNSALVACERANSLFPGWASPHSFHAAMLKDIGRTAEARDAARFALQMPLWTVRDVDCVWKLATLAGYKERTSLTQIYKRLYEDNREKDVQEGKAPQQVALDRAAYLLDYAVVQDDCSWDDIRERLADLYRQAGLEQIATFVTY